MVEFYKSFTCQACKGNGVKTDENGVQYDDVCDACGGSGTIDDTIEDTE